MVAASDDTVGASASRSAFRGSRSSALRQLSCRRPECRRTAPLRSPCQSLHRPRLAAQTDPRLIPIRADGCPTRAPQTTRSPTGRAHFACFRGVLAARRLRSRRAADARLALPDQPNAPSRISTPIRGTSRLRLATKRSWGCTPSRARRASRSAAGAKNRRSTLRRRPVCGRLRGVEPENEPRLNSTEHQDPLRPLQATRSSRRSGCSLQGTARDRLLQARGAAMAALRGTARHGTRTPPGASRGG